MGTSDPMTDHTKSQERRALAQDTLDLFAANPQFKPSAPRTERLAHSLLAAESEREELREALRQADALVDELRAHTKAEREEMEAALVTYREALLDVKARLPEDDSPETRALHLIVDRALSQATKREDYIALCTCDRWACSHRYDPDYCESYIPLATKREGEE